MPTSKETMLCLLGQLSLVDGIAHRAMMGEYIIYHHGKIAAYVCDNCLFVKPVDAARNLLPDTPLTPPFEGARDMLPVADTSDCERLRELFEAMYPELPEPVKKKKKPRQPPRL